MEKPDEVREVAQKYDSDAVRLTYDDYCRMPAGLRYELVEGAHRTWSSRSFPLLRRNGTG